MKFTSEDRVARSNALIDGSLLVEKAEFIQSAEPLNLASIITEEYCKERIEERRRVREILGPASECPNCSRPVCCYGVLVPTTLGEAALIVQYHYTLMERLRDAIMDAAERSNGACACLFQDPLTGKCEIYAVAPWNCAGYYLAKGEDPAGCEYKKMTERRDRGEPLKYGRVAITGLNDFISKTHLINQDLGISDIWDKQYLSAAIVNVMCAVDPKGWGQLWRERKPTEREA